QQRAEIGFLERSPGAREPVGVQPPVVDALLEIDAHGAERRQRAIPAVARIDVLGSDGCGFALRFAHVRLPMPGSAGRDHDCRSLLNLESAAQTRTGRPTAARFNMCGSSEMPSAAHAMAMAHALAADAEHAPDAAALAMRSAAREGDAAVLPRLQSWQQGL